jgi:hypothetical protein
MTDFDDFEQKLKHHRATVAKANDMNKAAVFDALSAAGITEVVVGFDGEGDSGQIESVAARSGQTSSELPTTAVTIASTQWGADDITAREMPLSEAVEALCYGYLEQEHGGWENNDGAYGEFTFDVTERRIELDFNARFSDFVSYSHSF